MGSESIDFESSVYIPLARAKSIESDPIEPWQEQNQSSLTPLNHRQERNQSSLTPLKRIEASPKVFFAANKNGGQGHRKKCAHRIH
jgi:hypothetical protein